MLGFYHNSRAVGPSFVAVAAPAGPSFGFDDDDWRLLGCCHGRVLLRSGPGWLQLLVWDPVTGHRRCVRLGRLLLGAGRRRHPRAPPGQGEPGRGRATAGRSDPVREDQHPADGLSGMDVFSLQLWVREAGADGVASTSWVLRKSINLDVFTPVPRAGVRVILLPLVRLLGVDEDGISAFIWTIEGIFMLHLEDEMLMKKVSRMVDFVYPYSSFYVAGYVNGWKQRFDSSCATLNSLQRALT